MQRYVPNQNLVIKPSSIQCGDGKEFDFVPWSRDSRQAAHAAANSYEYDLRAATAKRLGKETLTEREYHAAVRGIDLNPTITGSVVSTTDPKVEANPYASLLGLKRKMSPEYKQLLEEKSEKFEADIAQKQARAELEKSWEFISMNEHAKSTYRLAVADPESKIVADRIELLKIAEAGEYEKYWQEVNNRRLDDNLVKPAKPEAEKPEVTIPNLPEIEF